MLALFVQVFPFLRLHMNKLLIKRRELLSCQMDQDLDKISQLPEEVIDRILSLLPIRDAVRTSVLSSKWRFRSTTLSKLVFDSSCVSLGGNCSREFVKIVDNVLLLHSCVIQNFSLANSRYEPTCDIDRWIRYLSKASISELILFLGGIQLYKLPSCLFSFECLTLLDLYNCSFTIPPAFRGFKNLKVLILESVPLSERVLENLVSGSCHLERMILNLYHFKNLNIDTPQLNYLYFEGLLEGISFKDTYGSPLFHMVLQENKTYLSQEVDAITGYINLSEFFAPLRKAQTLIFDRNMLQNLSVQKVPTMLAEPLLGLEFLRLNGVHSNNPNEISIILCLLRSAPNLKRLSLSAVLVEEIDDFDIVGVDDCSGTVEEYASTYTFAHLKSACFVGIGYSALEVGLIGVLLSNSPALQKLVIKATVHLSKMIPPREYNILKRLIRSQCASNQTEVCFVD